MFEILDFLSYLRTRRLVLTGSETIVRALIADPAFNAWKFNVTESLLAGVPAAICSVLVTSFFFQQPDVAGMNADQQFEHFGSLSTNFVLTWALPFTTFAVAFIAAVVFARGSGGLHRAEARRAYLIVEGSHGLIPQSVFLIGWVLLLPMIRVGDEWGISVSDVGDPYLSRQDWTVLILQGFGALTLFIGGVLLFWENLYVVPVKVARLCGHQARAGLRRRVAAHYFLVGWGGMAIGSGLTAIAYGLGYGWSLLVVLGRSWLFSA